jgi:hypothetical protein
VNNPIDGTTPSCAEVDFAGRSGLIDEGTCPLVPGIAGSVCGCMEPETPSSGGDGGGTEATRAPTPQTPAPTPGPGTYPTCMICGENMVVTRL